MNEYDRSRRAAGQSRARSSSSSSRSGSSHRSSTSSRGKSSSARRGGSHSFSRSSSHNHSHGRGSSHNRRNPYGYRNTPNLWPVIVGLVVVVAAVSIFFAFKAKRGAEEETSVEETTVLATELEKEVKVDGVNITGMSFDAAKGAILEKYPWAMKITCDGEAYEVANLMEAKVDQLLYEIYAGEPKESYTLDTSGLEEAITAQAAEAAKKWDKQAKNGSISEFDPAENKFVFTGAENGRMVDQERLIEDITKALNKKEFDAVIPAVVSEVEPEFNETVAREKYTTISTFTTNTTANSKRNTNVRLACEAINGTVLMPGEEFSFNEVVGQRTEAKGYQAAAAYSNGEVVQEIGGGVCQVSTTLYNAVLRAGLKTTVRRSHTYEPSYVTPGQDATVSYGGPDYKFMNNSSTAIGIRSSYADRVCTVSIYGIPILEEGVKYTLKSTKLKDTDIPAPTYEEDPTLQPEEEKVKSAGSQGSYWETRLVITKDGEVVSQDVDHNTTYKGHAPVVLRNTSGVVIPPEATTAPEETIVPSEGAGDGIVPTTGAESTTKPSEPGPSQPQSQPQTPSESSPASNNPGGPGFDPTPAVPIQPQAPSENSGPGGSGDGMVIAPPSPLTGVGAP